jgi:hypothetical protein
MHVVVQNVSLYSRLWIKLQIWLDDRAIAVRLPAAAGYVTPLRSLQGLRWVPSHLFSGYRELFVGVKPTGCDFYYSRPPSAGVMNEQSCISTLYRVRLKCDGTRWRTGGEVKEKLANGVGSQYSSHFLGTWCIQHYYRWCAHFGCQQSTELTHPPI